MLKTFILILLILLFSIFVFGGQETEIAGLESLAAANPVTTSLLSPSTQLNSVPVYSINNLNFA